MPTPQIKPPFFPIIYVRGYAGSESEVEDTVADPYMGFNIGSTKTRTAWRGNVVPYFFESPVVRLMKEYGYRDIYEAGQAMAEEQAIAPRSIVIYRYYDQVSAELGTGTRAPIEDFGRGLGKLVLRLRDKVCGDDAEARAAFRVYLVGHSMGGLVIRCYLQNDQLYAGDPAQAALDGSRQLVDKVFTYATPHNGIEVEVVGNIPAVFTSNNANNFNRERMATFLGLPGKPADMRSLNGKFDPRRFFCLVGTNARDYAVAYGWSARAVGPNSDGLVRIANAYVNGPRGPGGALEVAPRAYVYRSHSGHYGIVNSEDGYQNLVRFLFGNVCIRGELKVAKLTLPDAVEKERAAGRQVRASYHFESVARVRGARWAFSRRIASENSAVFRRFDELFPDLSAAPDDLPQSHSMPELFTVYLLNSPEAKVVKNRRSLGFSVDLGVLVPDYEVDGLLWMDHHFEGGYLFRDKLNLEATPRPDGGWTLRYGFDSATPNRATKAVAGTPVDGGLQFRVPVVQKTRPGIEAELVLTATAWNS